MGFVILECPHCGHKKKENCNAWAYGSPVKVCDKCNKEFIDKRFTELAVEGIDRKNVDPSIYLKGIGLFAAMTLLCVFLFIIMVKFNGWYPTKIIGCMGIGILGIILCTVLFIRAKLGIEEVDSEIYLKESEERLKNKEYAEKLKSYGYNVPDKYLN